MQLLRQSLVGACQIAEVLLQNAPQSPILKAVTENLEDARIFGLLQSIDELVEIPD